MKKKAINRIVIGEVGSGKTIVGFLIAICFLKNLEKGTACLVAPTEVLAFQHYQKLIEFKNSTKELDFLDCIFLSAKLTLFNSQKCTKKELKKFLEESENKNQKQFWIGTHAIFNLDTDFSLIMVDEQHRFGVKQRQKLAMRENEGTHFISFTATPIPRTLALTIYRNLKPHFLEKLGNRKPILSSLLSFDKMETELIEIIQKHLNLNKKIYLICPKVEDKIEEEELAIYSIEKAKTVFEKYFPDRILTVHGKQLGKKDILEEFKVSKDKHILIATTVVEVGVDVSEATLAVVLNAERFGLSALHQIRGRVGRNEYDFNQAVFVTYKEFLRSRRLFYITRYSDGFTLAQKDLEIRGSGDLLGNLQSGFDTETESLIGLGSNLYEQIQDEIDRLDLKSLPRLNNYLTKQSTTIWEE